MGSFMSKSCQTVVPVVVKAKDVAIVLENHKEAIISTMEDLQIPESVIVGAQVGFAVVETVEAIEGAVAATKMEAVTIGNVGAVAAVAK